MKRIAQKAVKSGSPAKCRRKQVWLHIRRTAKLLNCSVCYQSKGPAPVGRQSNGTGPQHEKCQPYLHLAPDLINEIPFEFTAQLGALQFSDPLLGEMP